MSDDVTARIVAAVELGRSGDRTAARLALDALWTEIGEDDGDAFHRCVLAHVVADLQDDDPYGRLVMGAVEDIARAIADGSTERLAGRAGGSGWS